VECVGVGCAYDLRKLRQPRIFEVVLLEKCIEAAERTRVAQLNARNVERYSALALGDGQHLRSGDIQNLGIRINEPPDQPRAGKPIDLRSFTCNPFHDFAPLYRRERPKIDRLACPWLIRRFIDSDAEILYVPASQVLAVAQREGAVPFDIPGVELTHPVRSAASMHFSRSTTSKMRGWRSLWRSYAQPTPTHSTAHRRRRGSWRSPSGSGPTFSMTRSCCKWR